MRRFGVTMLVLALLAPSLALTAAAEKGGYLVKLVGLVVSVDKPNSKIVLRHAMLETTPAGDEVCLVPRHLLRFLRPGMSVTATADTSRRPWRLTKLHHFHADETKHDDPSRVAEHLPGALKNG